MEIKQNSVHHVIYKRLEVSAEQLADFCQRWQVSELALFGSVLRDDFTKDSDVDFLVSYQADAQRGLFEKIAMKDELETLTQRPVDLVSKAAIENSRNWIRKQNILESAEVIYVA